MVSEYLAHLYVVSPTRDLNLAQTTKRLAEEYIPVGLTYWDPTPTNALRDFHYWTTNRLPQPPGAQLQAPHRRHRVQAPPTAPQIHEMIFVVTEFDLPDMTCYEFLRRIREHPYSDFIHIVVMDVVYDDVKRRRCQDRGAQYFAEPMNSRIMESVIREVIGFEFVRQDALRIEAQRQEAQRQEAQRQEAQRQEAQRQEAQRQEAQRQEAQRQEAQRQEAQRQLDRPSNRRGCRL